MELAVIIWIFFSGDHNPTAFNYPPHSTSGMFGLAHSLREISGFFNTEWENYLRR